MKSSPMESQRFATLNATLAPLRAEQCVAWAFEHLPAEYVLSSSLGVQATVSLESVTQPRPDI